LIIRIAIVSVALSISVMIVASSMVHGFKKEISQKIFDFWGHIQITEAFTSSALETEPTIFPTGLVDSIKVIERVTYQWPIEFFGRSLDRTRELRTNGGIKYAYQYIQYPAVITTKDDMEGILIKGVSEDYPKAFFEDYLVEGNTLGYSSGEDRDLIISSVTSDRLFLSVGDQIILHFVKEGNLIQRRFNVAGVYKTGLGEYDKKVAFANAEAIQEVLSWTTDQVSGIEVVLDDIEDLEILNFYLYQETLPPDIYTRSIRQRAASIFDWLELQNLNEVIILGLMMMVCVVNMITALLILIVERTQMIGVLKALGARNWQVRKVFIRQATNILVKGLLWGNVVGLGICLLQKKFEFVKLQEEDYYLSVAPIDFNLPMILLINFGTLLVTILFLILPSYFISRISPTKAIRFS
jgi:lipoprotein-releasing system permease protein